MSWRTFMNDYFTFTRKERIGLLAIVIIIITLWIFPKVAAPKKTSVISADTGWIAAAKKLERQVSSPEVVRSDNEDIDDFVYDKPADSLNKSKRELFYFDPNTLSFDGWRRLGLRQKTITTIQNYLAKGGHFYKPDDLKKIYGIHVDEYERIRSYIKIEQLEKKDPTAIISKNEFKKDQSSGKSSKFNTVNINAADTSIFIALPGIGSKLAARIVSFRDKLGGFYSVDQIAETYGLPDSTFQKIKSHLRVDNSSLKKININTATKDDMKSHPYIKWNLANAIVEYRNQHGNYTRVDDLKKISVVTEEVFVKLKPYISVE